MQLKVLIDERVHSVQISDSEMAQGRELFARMDHDMASGWKMGTEYIEQPNAVQRAQIVANRLLVAIEQGRQSSITAMAAYILSKLPKAVAVRIDMAGEPLQTEFYYSEE